MKLIIVVEFVECFGILFIDVWEVYEYVVGYVFGVVNILMLEIGNCFDEFFVELFDVIC